MASSAVAINIFNPQMPAQQTLDKGLYNYPQGSIYNPQPGQQPYVMQPPPGVMPGTVLQNSAVPGQKETPAIVPGDSSETVSVTAEELAKELTDASLKDKENVIAKIATEASKPDPSVATRLVSDNKLMDTLSGIISQDVSKLQGPSDKQVEMDKKKQSGQSLSPEEETVYQQPYEQGIAEENKCLAMYALAPLWEIRQNTTQELGQKPVAIQDLPGFNAVLDTATKTDKQKIKLAALRAITHVARSEDSDYLTPALPPLPKENDPEIREVLGELRTKLETKQV
jgi:hypothetical protein